MKIHRPSSVLFLLMITAGLLTAVTELMAGPLKVNSATPDVLVWGNTDVEVVIKGVGLSKAKNVRFLVNKSNNDTGRVEVRIKDTNENNDETLIAVVTVPDRATVSLYDIEVQLSSGRKGKGTGLLSVQATIGKKDIIPCDKIFDLANPANCNCEFTMQDQSFQNGTPPLLIWEMQSNCSTSETLVIQQFESVSSAGTGATLTAVEGFDGFVATPFKGSAVVAAEGHRAGLFAFNIDIGLAPADVGCGADQLNSAVSFVLDGFSPDPDPDPKLESQFRNTRWNVLNNSITSTSGAVLCTVMEFDRTDLYLFDTIEGRVSVRNNVITVGSYIQTGILFRGFGPANNGLEVSRNTIRTTAVTDANAIQFGPIFDAGTVERNLISFSDGTGVGVLVVGDGTTDVAINQNDVEGGSIGVLVDDQVVSATIKSNILTGGTAGTPGAIGVCTDAVSNIIRANRINNYEEVVSFGDCTTLASPAD